MPELPLFELPDSTPDPQTSDSKTPTTQPSAELNVKQSPEARAALLHTVYERFRAEYGEVPLVPRRGAMHELISTILSQRTTAANEDAAYQELRELGDWDAIVDAPTEAVAHAIRLSNYPDQKAPRIQATLKAIKAERGNYDLDFLSELPPETGLKWLTALPGVGVKTASLVLLFNYAKPVFPVDTHVHRVTTRIGAIPKMGEQAAHKVLLALLPPEPPLLYELHINLLKHGQRVCSFSFPKCGKCVLQDVCDAYQIYGGKVPAFKG